MAAGLSLRRDHVDDFKAAFVAVVLEMLDPAALQQQVLSDGELAADELDHRHADALRLAGPWGQGFPEPLFDGHFGSGQLARAEGASPEAGTAPARRTRHDQRHPFRRLARQRAITSRPPGLPAGLR